MKKILFGFILLFICFIVSGQTNYNFTNAGVTGKNGPTQTDINNAYSGTNLQGAVTVNSGYQTWIVPSTGRYLITAAGAAGGSYTTGVGGNGAMVKGEFDLTEGDEITIVVGQMGDDANGIGDYQDGGGGGASYVELPGENWIVAAGGGGATYNNKSGVDGNASTSGSGEGGSAVYNRGSGGGGLTGDGSDGGVQTGGLSYTNGSTGGDGQDNDGDFGWGGFGGGGGGANNNYGGGGGGGFTGGAGGNNEGGNGGYSYNDGANPEGVSGHNSGHGYVSFTLLSTTPLVTPDPTNVTANLSEICLGMSSNLSAEADATATISWYTTETGGTPFGTTSTGENILVNPGETTIYYAESLNPPVGGFDFTANNSHAVDHNSYSGDDRGGIAVTQNYYYYVGDSHTVRYNMPGLTNPVSLTRSDGIFSDLAGSGTLYSFYNTNGSYPNGTSPNFTANAIRVMTDNLSGSTIINLSQSITFGGSEAGIFAGTGFVIAWNDANDTFYKIDLPSGNVSVLGTGTYSYRSTENWAHWGVAEEYNGVYTIYNVSSQNIRKYNINTGEASTANSFSNITDMGCFTYAPWYNRWYFHYESVGQFGGGAETAGYADAVYNVPTEYTPSSRIPVTVTVNPLPAAPTAGNNDLVYNGEAQNASLDLPAGHSAVWYSSAVSNDVVMPLSETNAGSYTGWATMVTDATGCESTARTEITLNIATKELTVANAAVTTKVYDKSTAAAITGASLAGVVGADDVTLANATSGTFNDPNVGTNKPVSHSMSLTGTASTNYSLTSPVLTGEITPKELTVANAAVTSKVYDGTAAATITGAELVGLVGNPVKLPIEDDVVLGDHGTGEFADANAGNDKVVNTSMTISGNDTGNYYLTQPALTGDITAKELTVADAVVTSKVYDGTTDAAITGATIVGVVGADDVILTGEGAGQFADANVGIDKSVTTTMGITGAAEANYTITQPVLTGDITAKELTVADAVVTTKVYDGTVFAEITGATLTGVVGADDVTLMDADAGLFDTPFVGTDKPVASDMFIDGAGIANYTFTLPALTGEVTPKELTVENAAVTAKVYDGTTVAGITGATLVGLVDGNPVKQDDVTLGDDATGVFADANAGVDKAVTTAMTISGAEANNYFLTQPALTGDITAKELTVADAVVTSKVYDGTTDAAITGATLVGVVGADDVTLTGEGAGQFADANAGVDKPVTTTMGITGAAEANYTITQPVLTGDITAKELTVADAVVTTKVYDGTVLAEITGATLDGVEGSDDVALTAAASGQFDDANVGTDKPVTTAMTLSGAAMSNYTLTQPVLTGEITAKELLIAGSFEVEDKVYDGTTDATITINNLALNGLIGGEDVTLAPVAEFTSAEVGDDIEVVLTDATVISGAAVGNYVLSMENAPITSASITTGTNVEEFSLLEMSMYPNPVTEELTVELENNNKECNVMILNTTGQVVYTGTITDMLKIDTSNMETGVYFVRIDDGSKQILRKLIKN